MRAYHPCVFNHTTPSLPAPLLAFTFGRRQKAFSKFNCRKICDSWNLYSFGTFTTSSPKTKAMCAKVLVVKLWRPVSHLDTSDSFFPSRCANIRWDIPFSFSRKSILSAMAKESSNSALVSSETLARHSLNNALVFIN